MNREKIQSIKLNNFRGATKPLEINFDPEKSMIMIFGENGTGKSTLVDAIDFIFNKECGSLKEKSSANKNHIPSINSPFNQVKISINNNQNSKREWDGSLNGKIPVIKGCKDHLSVKILRRDKILTLVNAEPRKRYEALKDFIDLPNIRSSEDSLRRHIKNKKQELDSHISTKTTEDNTLKKSWEDEGRQEENHLKWAEKISKKQNNELNKEVIKYSQCIKTTEKFIADLNEFKDSNKELSESNKKLKLAQSNLNKISQNNQPQEIVDILQKTYSFLNQKDANQCPACEQPINSKELKKRISDRLDNMNALVKITKEHELAKKQQEIKEDVLRTKKEKLNKSRQKLAKFLEGIIHENQAHTIDEIKQLQKTFDQYCENKYSETDFENIELFISQLNSIIQELNNIYKEKDRDLNQLNIIKNSFLSLKNTESKIINLNSKKLFLEKILKIIENERKSYVENILDSISQDVENSYSKLHPNENLDKIKLYLKPRVQGSLEIKSDFQGNSDVPPQAYFSDSHLDTLGICVFIAMAKHFKNNIIILDDVLTSVDQPHIERFIEMLHNENNHFNQIILTTHYRPWREKYKFHRQSNSDIQLIELSPFWSLEDGIKSNQTKLSIEELENIKQKTPFDRQNAGSKSGIFLESLFDDLTLLYKLPVPRKPEPIYTLGELMNCFSKKFIQKIEIKKNNNEPIQLSSIMDELFQMAEPIRNQVGCHWNNIGQDVSDHQIMDFLDRTIEFGKMLICNRCGMLPKKKKSDCWKCHCENTSLYPLKK